ncbi:MAG: hypothetical protein ACYTHN_04420 [Planctomycetota bacterium]|jgi:hypothetical protein
MAEEKWNLGRTQESCIACEQEIPPGQERVSALIFTGVEFERRAYCARCWETVRQEDLYSFWRTIVNEKEDQPQVKKVNVRILEDLFLRMIEEEDPQKEGITFLVGMILVQKRILKYREVRTQGGKQIVVLGRPRSKVTYSLVDPGVAPERLEVMQTELMKILDEN